MLVKSQNAVDLVYLTLEKLDTGNRMDGFI
jgi:hypothetical protein